MQDTFSIERDIFALIRHYLAGSPLGLARSTALYQDLHIAGVDAWEFLNEIAERYDVTFDGFKFNRYFPDESEAFWCFWASRVGFKDRRRQPISIGHLLDVIERRAWFDPDEANNVKSRT